MNVPSLTAEQRRKIEENKQRALAKRAEKTVLSSNASKIEENKQRALAKRAEKTVLSLNASSSCSPSLASANHTVENCQQGLKNKYNATHPLVYQKHVPSGSSFSEATINSKTIPKFYSSNAKKNVPQPSVKYPTPSSGLKSFPTSHSTQAQCLKGKCVLVSPDTFSVDVGYHSSLIEFFKQQKTKSYGEDFLANINFKCLLTQRLPFGLATF